MKSQPLPQYPTYPTCPHLSDGPGQRWCAKLSQYHGKPISVSAAKCRHVCKERKVWDGGGSSAAQFVHTAWTSWGMQQGDALLSRVTASYADVSRAVVVPDWWSELKAAFSDVLAFDVVTGIALSGSAIYGQLPTHDVDVVVYVGADWQRLRDVWQQVRSAVPKDFRGVNIDPHFGIRGTTSIFVELDVEEGKLYAPPLFAVEGRTIAQGIEVVRTGQNWRALDVLDAAKRWKRAVHIMNGGTAATEEGPAALNELPEQSKPSDQNGWEPQQEPRTLIPQKKKGCATCSRATKQKGK